MKSTVVKLGLVLLVISLLATTNVFALYIPCLACGGGIPDPTSWQTVGIDFTVSKSTIKLGQSIHLNAWQTSGQTLSPLTTWQFVAQSGGDIQVLNGQDVMFKPKKGKSAYAIYATAQDRAQYLNGYIKYKNILTTK